MSDREEVLGDPRLDFRMQIEQPHCVGYGGTAAAHFFRNVLLPHIEFASKTSIALRFLNRIEIGALQIFDQRKLEHFQIAGRAHDDRDFAQSYFLSSTPAPLACDQFMPAIAPPDEQRLNNSVLTDGIDQFLERFRREIFPGLQWARIDAGQGNLINVLALIDVRSGWYRSRADKGAQTFAESRLRHVREAIGSIPITQMTTHGLRDCCAFARQHIASKMSQAPNLITLGHSPDPDDAFMFYAIAKNKIDLLGYRFEHRLEDIQTLNERATRGELEISAVSIHACAYVADKYALMPCGASMGDGYGPIVIRKIPSAKSQTPTKNVDTRESLRDCVIAVPGKMTSAFLALQLYLGHFDHVVVPFDRIFDAVKNDEADAGLIIHEGQLTYAQAGFAKVVDLGAWWKRETELPLPLGGNVIRKDLPAGIRHDLLEIVRQSIEYGLAHRDEAVGHALPYARDMDQNLAGKFIGMYVNEFTRDYGETGRMAIRRFLGDATRAGYVGTLSEIEFAK